MLSKNSRPAGPGPRRYPGADHQGEGTAPRGRGSRKTDRAWGEGVQQFTDLSEKIEFFSLLPLN